MVGVTGNPIDQYLARLRAGLRTPQERAEQILAEAEDHLRESVAAGIAIGMGEREAQEAAMSAFGSVRAVVRAHNLSTGQVARDLVMTSLKPWRSPTAPGPGASCGSGPRYPAADGVLPGSQVAGVPVGEVAELALDRAGERG